MPGIYRRKKKDLKLKSMYQDPRLIGLEGIELEPIKPIKPRLNKWSTMEPTGPHPLTRPSISYSSLCVLTLLNSAEQVVACSQVYAFVMHHFAYYRFAPISWQSNVRNAMCGTRKIPSKEFEFVGPQNSRAGLFRLKNEQDSRSKARLELIRYNLDTNRVREELYERMADGKLGLPRQLFYHVIGLFHRGLAGPENSAMFYHLLAGKIIPTEPRRAQYFREYRIEHSGNEPVHWSRWKYEQYDLKKFEEYSGWGEGLGEDEEEALTMDQKECQVFHEHVDEYFGLQKKLKGEGFDDWTTPLHSVVFESILFPYL